MAVKVENVLRKIKDFLSLKTDIELAVLLGVKPNTIATWKSRNSMDYQRVIDICREYRIDINELFLNTDFERKYYEDIVVIPKEYQYSYVSGLYEKDFIRRMPRGNLVAPLRRKIRAFEVEDGSMVSVYRGSSYVVGEYVPDLDQTGTDKIYVLVNAAHGIFVGKVEADEDFFDTVYLINEERPERECKVRMLRREIIEIWQVTHVVFGEMTQGYIPGILRQNGVRVQNG
ncbi:helix-turn-helix domain-containing protein [Sinomicrobium soli]|uniref:helix-turn-helix domain-containing protein n=1 Tax=Sinomicrobium sp. N-1-3-6 TaxID=2219864 RepID=UPI000DCD1069|nr:helix-turn-helix domain-containing protein [Sinomicrobium sp. N-1-3-6]RAV27460.1 hypothetical protein DN748_18475 [Sinomicrobium sp. N-1-3-6]